MPRVFIFVTPTEITMTLETCKLRYCRPSETTSAERDWHFEQVTVLEASVRREALEQSGCVVEMINSGNSAGSIRERLGGLLDPKRMMN
ncbi:MAG: hypothetical protein ABMA14_06750 [Hyphomonadaceae bacterium]